MRLPFLPILFAAACAPAGAQVFNTLFRVPASGIAPNTQSFIPAGIPNLGPYDGAIVFRRNAAPPSQSCRFTASVTDPTVAELVVQQSFMQPDDGIGGTGANWGATILYRMLRTGSTTIRVVWDSGACGFAGRGAAEVRTADDTGETYAVSATADPKSASNLGPASNSGHVGEPVNTFTGDLEDGSRDPDIDLGGPLPLRLVRYYSSGLGAALPGGGGGQGRNWMHNFDVRASVLGTKATVTLFGAKTVSFTQGASGDWTLSSAETVNYQFAGTGDNHRFADPTDGLIYSFNFGRLTEIQDGNGNKLTVTRAGASPGPDQVADGLGRVLKFTNSNGSLTKIEDQTGRSVTFTYNAGNLTGFTNANGKMVTYAYGTNGTMTSVALPAGNKPFTQTFDGSGKVTKQTDSRGNATTFAYGPAAGAATITNPLNAVLRDTHDADGNLLKRTDELGKDTSYTYDASRRVTQLTDRRGNSTVTTYHSPSGFPATITDALGNVTKFTYAAQVRSGFTFYNLTKIEYADGTSESRTYDNKGNVTTLTDRAGKNWAATYNSRGQVLTLTNPSGGATTYTYTTAGNVATLTLPAGDQTAFEYDAQLRVTKVTYPGGATRQLTYDALDNILTDTDERGKVTTGVFNENGRAKSMANGLNQTTQLTYDGDERVLTSADPLNHVTTRAYDEVGRPKSITDPTNVAATFGYDAAGRLTAVSDSGGKKLDLAYDAEGAVSSITDGLQRKWNMSRDKLGRTTQVSDPLGRTTNLTYDPLGRLRTNTNPAGETTETQYEARGLLSKVLRPENIAATFTRNDLGLITTIADPNNRAWASSYDSSGRRTAESDPLGRQTTFAYDNRQRVNKITLPSGGTVTVTYDAAGNQTRRQYSDGTDLQYSYDDANRPTGGSGVTIAYNAAGEITASNGLTMTRDNAGRLASITYAPNKTVTYQYNSQGLLSKITDWVGGSTDFSYDASRNVKSTQRPNGVVSTLTYAADGRLAKSIWSGATINTSVEWTRDIAGRIISENRVVSGGVALTAGSKAFTYDAASQRSDATYDNLGRITVDGGRTYTWDLASRLKGFVDAQMNTAYQYDAFGQLTNGARTYVWNYAMPLPVIAIEREGTADARYLIYTPSGQLIESIDANNQRRYYHSDERGNVLFLTGDAGTITDTYGYSPYGEVVTRTGTTENPYTFQGGLGVMQIGSSGLYYMRARFYDSASVRFLSKDPMPQMDPLEINPYQYAAGNPVRNIDPSGMKAVEAGAGGAQIISSAQYAAMAGMLAAAQARMQAENARRAATARAQADAAAARNALLASIPALPPAPPSSVSPPTAQPFRDVARYYANDPAAAREITFGVFPGVILAEAAIETYGESDPNSWVAPEETLVSTPPPPEAGPSVLQYANTQVVVC